MKRARSIDFWLEQVVWWAQRLQEHVDRTSVEEFLANKMAVDAASWCISCIGEACGKILETNPEFGDRNPAMQLHKAYAARNRYVHGYFDLDPAQIWDTATISVPGLASAIQEILADK